MGVANSALVAVGALTPQFTTFGMVSTMAIGCYRKRDWWGFLPVYAAIMAYHVLVRTGGNIENPLDLYILSDYVDAAYILYIIYPVLLFFFCWIGFVFHKIFSNVQLLTITEKIPYLLRSQTLPVLVVSPDGDYSVKQLTYDRNSPDRNWGVVGLTPSWFQNLVTLVWYFGIAVAQIIYDMYVVKAGNEVMAFLVLLIVPPAWTLLFFLYCRYVNTDPGTFGLTKKYLVKNASLYNLKSEEIDAINQATNTRVAWTILPVAVFSLFGAFILGGWRLIDADVDRQWLAAVGLWAFYLIVLFVVVIIMRPDGDLFMRSKGAKTINDSEGYVEKMAASTPSSINTNKTMSERLNSVHTGLW